MQGAVFVKDYPREAATTMSRSKDGRPGRLVQGQPPWQGAVFIAKGPEGIDASGAMLVSYDGRVRPSTLRLRRVLRAGPLRALAPAFAEVTSIRTAVTLVFCFGCARNDTSRR